MKQMEIPLANLRPGKEKVNSRRTDVPLDGLMRSIEKLGVLVPLGVVKNGRDKWDVVDGNRRLEALTRLTKRDKIKQQALLVPCYEMPEDGHPLELSMVVNIEREGLHPVDKFQVMTTLVDLGMTIEAMAQRYGMKVSQVRQILALGRMAPAVHDAWRAGTLSAEAAEAFTITTDHKAQTAVLKKLPKNAGAWYVQHELLKDDTSVEALIKFVGRANYEKAGHQVNDMLFATRENMQVSVSDLPALKRMALDRLNIEAASLVHDVGWKWAVTVADAPKDWASWKRTYQAHGSKWTKEQMATLGAVVEVGSTGELNVYDGILKPGDKVPTPKAKKKSDKAKSPAKFAGPSMTLSRKLDRLYCDTIAGYVAGIHPNGEKRRYLNIMVDPQILAALLDKGALGRTMCKAFATIADDYFRSVGKLGCLVALGEMGKKPKPNVVKKLTLGGMVIYSADAAKNKGWLPPQLRVGK